MSAWTTGRPALAINALESVDAPVRAMAAGALRGWEGTGNAAWHLARHLDDTWAVAVKAARSLQSMRQAGRDVLESWARRSDLAGILSRQMLWRARGREPHGGPRDIYPSVTLYFALWNASQNRDGPAASMFLWRYQRRRTRRNRALAGRSRRRRWSR